MAEFAYLFERFPSFVQTFCYREVGEMLRQGAAPWVVSIRRPDDAPPPEDYSLETFYLPEEKALRAEIDARRAELPHGVRKAIGRERGRADSQRVFEAVWLAGELRRRGIRHVHAHFAGMAARTAWWLRELYGFRYSFTGHANDIFCDQDFPVTTEMLVRDANFIVTETDYARRWLEERFAAARGKTFRVFNGIDTKVFPPRVPRRNRPRLLTVGRYVEKKGFGDLVTACGWLQARGRDFECVLVGGGPLEETLAAQIAEARLGDCVQLAGPRSQAEVRRLLAEAAVFVLPCVPEAGGGSDNLPTVVMEAMACGVPVVCTPVAGVPEMIVSGINGLLVAPKEPRALAEALEKLLDDPALAARLGEAGQRTAREKFEVKASVEALRALLKEAGAKAGGFGNWVWIKWGFL